MVDNLTQLDQSGTNCQFTRVYLGPTIGWVLVPITPEIEYASTTALTLTNFASRVMLKAACKTVNLPAVKAWVLASYQANQSAFDRSIWIKDLAGLAGIGAAAITIAPNGSDLIDGQASFTIQQAYQLIRLFPLTDLTGWYVG